MSTIVGILTFISMINTTSERLKARDFLALHPMESISLNSFVLLEHLALLLTLTLAINCELRNFLNKATGIINFAKPFLNIIDDTMI